MFNRQWFARDTQLGLNDSLLEFEYYLSGYNLDKAVVHLLSQDLLPSKIRKRLYKRLLHLQNRREVSKRQGKLASLRLSFFNFWPDMLIKDCQLLDFVRYTIPTINIVITEDHKTSDIMFCSCYGQPEFPIGTEHCLKILFLGENVRPQYSVFDYSITSDISTYCGRNIYMPLWMLELDWFDHGNYPDRSPLPLHSVTKGFLFEPHDKKQVVVYIGNNNEPHRMSVINELRRHDIDVDQFGSQSKPVENKLAKYNEYRLCLSFENSFFPGYITEKLIQAYQSRTQLLYWGALEGSLFENSSYPHVISTHELPTSYIHRVKALLSDSRPIWIESLVSEPQLFEAFKRVTVTLEQFLKPYTIY